MHAMPSRFVWILVVLVCSPVESFSGPVTLSPLDLNTVVAMEATQDALTSLVLTQTLTPAPQVLGTWQGTINDSGWNLGFTGNYLGIPLEMFHVGTLDLVNGRTTWEGTGTFDGAPLTTTGMIEFDPSWLSDLLYVANRVIVRGTQVFATATTAVATAPIGVVAALPATIEVGTYSAVVSEGAIAVGDRTIERWTTAGGKGTTPPPPAPPPTATTVYSLGFMPSEGAGALSFFIYQLGSLNEITGAAEFTAVIPEQVPEPSTLLLFGTAVGVRALASRRRRRRQTDVPPARNC